MPTIFAVAGQARAGTPSVRRRAAHLAIAAATAAGVTLRSQTPPPSEPASRCRVDHTLYSGWKAVQMTNPWVTLTIVPQLGGRLMQVTFGGHDYLWVNDELKGQSFTPEESAARKRWFNYGGDKIWPMPEGNNDEQHWPGAAGAVLDAGAFTATVLPRDGECVVRLEGPIDPMVGQQYIREIRLGPDSPAISFHAVMKNVSGYPQTWSEQSVSQYTTADHANLTRPNADFRGLTPANPRSAYPNAFHIRGGPASSGGYTIRDGLFEVQTIDASGEVWIDSPGEWLAVVDGAAKYAMIERFRYQRGAEYPGGATVIFYTAPQTGSRALFYMEAEINSPMIRLDPGETYALDTQWVPTRLGSDLTAVTYAGAIGRPLGASFASGGLTLTGSFGVFQAGHLEVRYYDTAGMRLGTRSIGEVVPTEPVTLQQSVDAPPETARISLHLIDRAGIDRGPLGEVAVTRR